MAQNFLQMLLNGTIGQGMLNAPIQYNSAKQGFVLDKDGRIAVDPVTGLNVKKKDRRKFESLLQNPQGITAANALNQNVPKFSSSFGGGLGSNLGSILGGAK